MEMLCLMLFCFAHLRIKTILIQVMVFVHARNETVRTATVLSEIAKNSGDSRLFEPDHGPRYGDALKQVSGICNCTLNMLIMV